MADTHEATAAPYAGAESPSALSYASSGVDLAAGDEAVRRVVARARTTFGPEVIEGGGGFAGLFAFASKEWTDPVLVSSTDGVGTKCLVARDAGRYETIGLDLVAMCADDVVCTGATPLFMLDYLAVGQVEPAVAEAIVAGVAKGARRAGAALVGGEIAEHPDAMAPGDFDLAGFVVGAVEREALLGPERVRPGDLLVGMLSPGLRSNGYSLARRALLRGGPGALDAPAWPGAERSLADELLEPSVIYTPAALALARSVGGLRSLAHITGGGIAHNLARALPPGCTAVVDRSAWEVPRIFEEVRRAGNVDDAEMWRVFNLGLGMIAVVAAKDADAALDVLGGAGIRAAVIGRVDPADLAGESPGGPAEVRFEG